MKVPRAKKKIIIIIVIITIIKIIKIILMVINVWKFHAISPQPLRIAIV